YTLLKKEEVKPTPIARYTNEYIKPRGLEYEDLGSYICRVSSYWKRTLVCAFDARTMNTDWDYVPSIADHDNPIYTQPGALVTSPRNDRIYNFANIQKPGYGNISNFFTAGATTPITNWRPGSDLQTCLHAVESQASNN